MKEKMTNDKKVLLFNRDDLFQTVYDWFQNIILDQF